MRRNATLATSTMSPRVHAAVVLFVGMQSVAGAAVITPPTLSGEAKESKAYVAKGSQTLSNAEAVSRMKQGRELLEAGDLANAEAAFAEAAKLEPKAYAPRLGLADVSLRRGKRPDAERYMKEALALAPGSAEVAAAAGRLAYGTGRAAEGEKQLLRAIALDPSFVTPRTDLGEMYYSAGRYAESAQAFRDAIAVAPAHPGAQFGLGRALAAQRDMGGAAAAFDAAARLAPASPLPLLALAELQSQGRQFDQALATLKRAGTVAPASIAVRIAHADTLAASGARDRAIAEYGDLLKNAPKADAPVLNLKLGTVQQAAGQLDEAQASFQRAAALEPKFHMAHNNVAWLTALRKRDMALGLKHAERALELVPDSATYADTLGYVHAARGDFDKAIEAYARALKSAPNAPVVLYHLAVAEEAKGRTDLAINHYKAALDSGKAFDDRLDAQRRLDALNVKR